MKLIDWANKKKAERMCPKCNVRDIFIRGGMKRYKCQNCGYYFDNPEWEKEDNKFNKKKVIIKEAE